jgi:hypothetical protein
VCGDPENFYPGSGSVLVSEIQLVLCFWKDVRISRKIEYILGVFFGQLCFVVCGK